MTAEQAGGEVSDAIALPDDHELIEAAMSDKPEPAYRVVCISLYHDDIAALGGRVDMLKTLGWSGANKSHLIRIALARLDSKALREIAAEQKAKR